MTARTSPPARPPKTPSAAPSLSSLRKKHVSTSESPAVDLLNRVAGTSNASPQEHSTVVFGGTISGEDSAAPASANQLQPSSHYNYLSASLGHGASTKPLDGISLNSKSSLDSVKTAKDSLRHIISRTPTGNSSKISTGGGTNDSIGRSSGKAIIDALARSPAASVDREQSQSSTSQHSQSSSANGDSPVPERKTLKGSAGFKNGRELFKHHEQSISETTVNTTVSGTRTLKSTKSKLHLSTTTTPTPVEPVVDVFTARANKRPATSVGRGHKRMDSQSSLASLNSKASSASTSSVRPSMNDFKVLPRNTDRITSFPAFKGSARIHRGPTASRFRWNDAAAGDGDDDGIITTDAPQKKEQRRGLWHAIFKRGAGNSDVAHS